ncbi:MAG: hypothetical protein C3F08_00445 [Candidatus Methylomirabilota bacterium]|nr:MAG: hypothetical protein C3F08_00445 [candidate division NC10 bacterium]
MVSPPTGAETISRRLIVGIVVLYCLVFFSIDHTPTKSLTVNDPEMARLQVEGISTGSTRRPIAFLVLGLSGMFFLMKKRRLDFAIHKVHLCLIALYVAWAWLSYFWADDPLLVMKRVVSFSLTLFAALALSRALPKGAFLSVVFGVSVVFVLIGIVAEKLLGTFNPLVEGYRFSGTRGPEGQGFDCGILLLSAWAISDGRTGFARLAYRSFSVAGLLFLVLTRARGPFAGVMIAMVAYHYLTRRRLNTFNVVFIALLIACLLVLVLGWADFSAALLMGRQDEAKTLTGRIPLWAECLDYVTERPWTGYGFNGFWTEERVMDVSKSQDWINFSGHSVYLDTVLNLGIVGLALLVAVLLSALSSGVRRVKRSPDVVSSFLVAVILLICIDGLLSSVVIESGFSMFLLLAGAFYLGFSGTGDIGDQEVASRGGIPH